VVLASGNSVGWVPLLCGLVSGGALWGIVRPRVRDAQDVRRTDKERSHGIQVARNQREDELVHSGELREAEASWDTARSTV
jgi:hypothetical protein